MEHWAWQEFLAQVEEHGPGAVEFVADDPDAVDNEGLQLTWDITDIKYEDGKIKVMLL